jgi:hypothetical protein
MAVSAPQNPLFRAAVGSPWRLDSGALHARDLDFVPRTRPDKRFLRENKTIVPELVSSKLPEFEPISMVTRPIEATDPVTEAEPFARLRPVVVVANKGES